MEGRDFDASERDPLFEDAARLIVQSQMGSTSLIQRRMKLGYNRAGRLMDQLEAAGDFFLMPSLFEPCGLNQLYSLRYGTVPLVRLTGGLKDTVKPWPAKGATGIGFVEPDIDATIAALQQAELLFSKPTSYKRVQQNGMAQNFSWPNAAAQYVALYHQALDSKAR